MKLFSAWFCLALASSLAALRVLSGLRGQLNRLSRQDDIAPVNTFQGIPLHYVDHPPISTVHCVGDNFVESEAYLYRSCHYRNLCYDMSEKRFTVYTKEPLTLPDNWSSSTQLSINDTVVVAGPQIKKWFPVEAQEKQNLAIRIGAYSVHQEFEAPESFYQMNVTWLPYHRHTASYRNPGHLIWDEFLALFTLLEIFERTEDRILLTHINRTETAEFKDRRIPQDRDLAKKFLPLMGQHKFPLRERDLVFLGTSETRRYSSVVCATHGLVGSGLFSDHGDHRHGHVWPTDYEIPHNHGRGKLFSSFRRYMMHNINVDPAAEHRTPYRILISEHSSNGRSRNLDMTPQLNALDAKLTGRASVESIYLSALTLRDQVDIMSQTSIFVSVVGGATISAFFLPKDASVLLFYGGRKRLDFDLWNNFPHVRVHWIPIKDKDGKEALDALVELVSKELDYLDAFRD